MTMYKIPVFKVRVVRDYIQTVPYDIIDTPQKAVACARRHLNGVDREHLVVLMMNVQNHFIGYDPVSIGSTTETIAKPNMIFKVPIVKGAAGIILVHNHPSGDPTPSPSDLKLFPLIQQCGDILEIKLLDAIILGDGTRKCWSLEHGLIDG